MMKTVLRKAAAATGRPPRLSEGSVAKMAAYAMTRLGRQVPCGSDSRSLMMGIAVLEAMKVSRSLGVRKVDISSLGGLPI